MFFYQVTDVTGGLPIVPIFYFNKDIGPMNCRDIKSENTNRAFALVSAGGG